LHKLAASDQYDDEKAKAITDKLGKALANITFLRVQERHQIFALLTPEQRNLLKSLQHEHSEGHPRFPSHEDGKPGAPSHPQ
jgi:Spy/CpxP family protein refolding chaperone